MISSGSPTGIFVSPYGASNGCWSGVGESVRTWDHRIADFVNDATSLGVDGVLSTGLQEQLVQLLAIKRGPFRNDRLDAVGQHVEHLADFGDGLLIHLADAGVPCHAVKHESGGRACNALAAGQLDDVTDRIDVPDVVRRQLDG
jgi:hypothetical protein